jgi:hypothetical protein
LGNLLIDLEETRSARVTSLQQSNLQLINT